MPTVSIIVPVYNDAIYIRRCLDSLINQTLKDIEIIVVDDGSTDTTPAVLKEYLKKDSRICVITQENSKQGTARNNGLKIAKGEYIAFIDSDDWVDTDYFEKMLEVSKRTNVDITVSSAKRIKKFDRISEYFGYEEEKIYTSFEEIVKTLKIPPFWFVWGKLYKKNLLSKMRFEEEVFYEDAEFLLKVIHHTSSIATVPKVYYYYFSNPNSTMKSKHSIAKDQDKINAMVNVVKYAKEHNILLDEITIFKDRHLLYTIKYYTDRKEYYLLGVKFYTKYESFDDSKTFVVFNTACFGDVLVCNTLCQNIKRIYPKSKLVFVVNKPFYDVAKNQKDVDEVIIYDKKGRHKGLMGMCKFINEFPYKHPFASFVTYRSVRNMIIANFIKSRFVFEGKKRLDIYNSMQESHTELLQVLTNKKIENIPIKCFADKNLPEHLAKELPQNEKYIALCSLTKNPPKDMPLDVAFGIIKGICAKGYKAVFVGTGDNTIKYSQKLKNRGCEFIDLVNKTTIPELGSVLLNCSALISVDTGTMHYGYALGVPTTAIFYESITPKNWAPNTNLYNVAVIKNNQTAENICNKTFDLINGIQPNKTKIAVCFGCDNNYVQHLAATISSILKSKNENEFLNFYIIDGGITKQNKKKLEFFQNNYDCKIEYVKPDMDKLKNCNTFKGDYISLATYYRLFIPELLQKEDKVLYLDCDIIVRKPLSELYNKDFANCLILGIIDVAAKYHSLRLGLKKYINAGVILINSKKMRDINSDAMIIDWINSNNEKIECHDQDVINAVFNPEIKYIEDKWNAQVKKEHDTRFSGIKDPSILHFISPKKPWVLWKPLNSTHWAYEYFEALKGTPWEGFIKTYTKRAILALPLRILYPMGLSRKFIRWIFSIRNSDDRQYKILTFLGARWQYRKKRIINSFTKDSNYVQK